MSASGKDGECGILACAAYLPRGRIARETLEEATGWVTGMGRRSSGTRHFANWDEDSITMAVEAARHALQRMSDEPTSEVASLNLATTTAPFADRSNAGIVREALNLNADLSPADRGGSRRAATSALIDLWARRQSGPHLLCAADCIDALPASDGERDLGHGAAAVVIGAGNPVARIRAAAARHEDFVDRYRESGTRFEYRLEPRWTRDAGTVSQLHDLIGQVLAEADTAATDIKAFLSPLPPDAERAVLRAAGLTQCVTAAPLRDSVGTCGSAHPLVMLSWALESAEPGDQLLLIGAGQGFDVLLIEASGGASDDPMSVGRQLAAGRTESNYVRYAALRGLLPVETGLRGERDTRTAHSAHYRRHSDLTGFNGGRCVACGKLQFPRSRICVHCHADGMQTPESLAGLTGTVNSFTEDWLAYSPRPPLMFGNIHFPDGANVMMEFSDFLPGEIETGQSVRMAFRIKDIDTRRHFRRYFWKPVPLAGEQSGG
ncbi:zinc ribbon domain-containing protein [Elongatibacter sediminis]|uniref:Zinc ribbon domain-containing protein n=1 Tax=Elongatibacter sediminis TaxID=3119006 RepID=A0AAW9RD77_9GAMM